MTERETREIKTPGGHTLLIKTYITGREGRVLQVPYLKTSEEFPKELIDEKGLRAATFQEVQNQTLKTIIVSFDGKKDGENGFNLLDALLDEIPSSEFKFIVTSVNSIVSDPDAEEEKKTN